MNNIITAVFGGRREARTRALYQWDYGIILQFIGPALPVAYEVHFSASPTGEAAVVIGDEDGVAIPDEYLTKAGILFAWVYLHTGDSDGETRYTVTIPVTARAKPTDYEPTPVEQGVIQQAIAALNAGVKTVEDAVENIDQTLADALQAAKDSGEFDGPQGDPGSDGVSPAVQVTEITGGHRVTVTDATGAHTFDVMDGAQGDPGETGNGIASIVKTATGGLVDTYTITYTDGSTTTYTVTNGAEGDPGEGVPTGGTTGQMLVKATDADYDTEWVDPPKGEVTQEEFDALKQYVYDMSPVATVTAPVVSVPDAAPLDAEDVVVSIEPVQAGSGDPSPDNVRPISGWTGAKVTRTGKNLFDADDATDGAYVSVDDGSERRATGSAASGYIDVKPGYTYRISPNKAAGNWGAWYDINKGFISGFSAYSVPRTAPENAAYMRITVNRNDVNDGWRTNTQVELGSTATEYEPYQGDTYDIAFPSEADTVYGGSLGVTTGVLTVDRAEVDLGTLSWSAHQTYGFYSGGAKTTIKSPTGNAYPVNAICSNYKVVAQVNEMATNCSIACDTAGILYVHDDAYSEVTTFKAAMSGVQLVYELANPITYQLTPQQIALLRGNNTLWADTGGTTLTYRQDVAKLLEALMKPDESDMVASATYPANSFFTIGGTLYKATAAIATGETIQPGVNCTETTVADQLTAIFAQL